jgi:hypothetical protein
MGIMERGPELLLGMGDGSNTTGEGREDGLVGEDSS